MYRSFTYNNKKSTDFNIYIKDVELSFIGLDVQTQTVAGKGAESITGINKKNNMIKYVCNFTSERIEEHFSYILNWLNSDIKYKKLKDSFLPNRFKNAYVKEIEIESLTKNYCCFIVSFSYEPYIYHIFGENEIIFNNKIKLHNIYGTIAEPIIKIYGMGNIELLINNNLMTLKNVKEEITVNTVKKQVYSKNELKNSFYNYSSDHQFPILVCGENTITVKSGNVEKIAVIPNWRTIG